MPSACDRCPGAPLMGDCSTSSTNWDSLPASLRTSSWPSLHDGHARRVIAAVFEPFQAVEDDRRRVTRPDISDNSTHEGSSDLYCKHAHERMLRARLPPSGDRPPVPIAVVWLRSLTTSLPFPRAFACAVARAGLCASVILGGKEERVMAHPEGFR